MTEANEKGNEKGVCDRTKNSESVENDFLNESSFLRAPISPIMKCFRRALVVRGNK